MPKRSERDKFDARSFETNPYKGKSPRQIYKSLQWGNTPNSVVEIKSPESLIALGRLATLYHSGTCLLSGKNYFLCVGSSSNYLYFLPIKNKRVPVKTHSGQAWVKSCKVTRTDYLSSKGENEENYYYHNHEKPFPELYVDRGTGVGILIPSNNKGKRSYAVIEAGIVG